MWLKIFVETIFSAGLFINATLFIPQIIKILRTKKTEGLSLLTFGGFNFIQLFIILHAYLHHDTLLLLGTAASFITCGGVTILILIYQK